MRLLQDTDAPRAAGKDAIAELIAEIERYLEAVELFRALGHEPVWATQSTA